MTEKYHYAFDVEYSGIPKELPTDAKIFPAFADKESKGVETSILWDTGATHSSLSTRIVRELGLKSVDRGLVRGINSFKEVDIVIASIDFLNGWFLQNRRFSVNDIPGTDVLIGMDIIIMGDFYISNSGGKTQFSFAVPPFEHRISFTKIAEEINNLAAETARYVVL